MMVRWTISALGMLFLCLSTYEAAAQRFVTREGTATFTSSVPLHEFSGTSTSLNGLISVADSTVDFFIDLSTLRTGIGKRDRDMRETLDVKTYPFAEFTGKLTSSLDISSPKAQEARVEGNFSVHGVTRRVVITGTLTPRGEALELEASWILNLEEYDIEPPRLLIVKVDPEQDISIKAILHTQDP